MARQRAIVGIGELMLRTGPEEERPDGIAAAVPMHAARLGWRAIPIARVGQDADADVIRESLRAVGVEVDHVQGDPDLATGRLTVRSIAGHVTQSLDARTAFDNLQWDFDLEDVSQITDAVVFTALGRRHGQARTTMDRFLSECRQAVRLFDLTIRGDDTPDRGALLRRLDGIEGIVANREILQLIQPGSRDEPIDAVASSIAKRHGLLMVVTRDDGALRVSTAEESHEAPAKIDESQHVASITALLHGALRGWDWPRSLDIATRYAAHVRDRGEEPVPADLIE